MSVRNAILGLLAQQPRHGYELRAAFEALVGGGELWDVKPSQIYTTLSRLEAAGHPHAVCRPGLAPSPSRACRRRAATLARADS